MAPLDRYALAGSVAPVYESDSDLQGFVNVEQTPLRRPKTKSATPKKTVTFAKSAFVREIDSLKEYPEAVKSQIWLKRKDYNKFKESCRRIIEWVSSREQYSFGPDSQDEEDKLFCSRGLERYTADGAAKFMERSRAMRSDLYVLHITGASPDEIADMMCVHSAICVAEALDRAHQDGRVAKRYQREHTVSHATTSLLPNMLPKVRTLLDHEDATPQTIKASRMINRQPFRQVRFTAMGWSYE